MEGVRAKAHTRWHKSGKKLTRLRIGGVAYCRLQGSNIFPMKLLRFYGFGGFEHHFWRCPKWKRLRRGGTAQASKRMTKPIENSNLSMAIRVQQHMAMRFRLCCASKNHRALPNLPLAKLGHRPHDIDGLARPRIAALHVEGQRDHHNSGPSQLQRLNTR